MSHPPRPDEAANPSRRALAVVERSLLALLIAAGSVAWGVGIIAKGYDYDEVQRAHSVWLVAQGLRPYAELFEVHPPYFVLLTPILRRWPDPCDAVRALRLFAAVGNVAFLGGLVALGRTPEARGGRWEWLGVAFVAFEPRVLDYLVEFRIDGWGYALASWGIVFALRRPDSPRRWAAFGVLSGIATLLFCPKLAIFPPLLVVAEMLRARRAGRAALRPGVAYLLGLGVAALALALFLAANRIEVGRTYLLLFRYHALSNAHSGHRYGLLRQVVGTPLLLAPMALGALAWVVVLARRRSRAEVYLPALGSWMVIQSLLVAYQYKQYYAPWFLFGSAFVAVLGRTLAASWRPLGVLAFVAACGTAIPASLGLAQLWEHYRPARGLCARLHALSVLAGPDDRVVAPPPEHPIARRDVFFLWFNTSDPGGYDSERILEGLGPYRPLVSPEQNREALRAHPPAFVVLDAGPFAAPYPEGQWQALREFLPRHAYRVVRLGSLRLALRPDRYDRLRDRGLFEDAPGPLAPVMPFFK